MAHRAALFLPKSSGILNTGGEQDKDTLTPVKSSLHEVMESPMCLVTPWLL